MQIGTGGRASWGSGCSPLWLRLESRLLHKRPSGQWYCNGVQHSTCMSILRVVKALCDGAFFGDFGIFRFGALGLRLGGDGHLGLGSVSFSLATHKTPQKNAFAGKSARFRPSLL
jgi:hypothetical protein